MLFLLLACGISFSYFGWIIEHPENHPWMSSFVGVSERQMLLTYDALTSGSTITERNPGFLTIAETLLKRYSVQLVTPNLFLPGEAIELDALEEMQSGNLELQAISSDGLLSRVSFTSGGTVDTTPALANVTLEYTYRGNRHFSEPYALGDIRQVLVSNYYEPVLYSWAYVLFVIGMVCLAAGSLIGCHPVNPALPPLPSTADPIAKHRSHVICAWALIITSTALGVTLFRLACRTVWGRPLAVSSIAFAAAHLAWLLFVHRLVKIYTKSAPGSGSTQHAYFAVLRTLEAARGRRYHNNAIYRDFRFFFTVSLGIIGGLLVAFAIKAPERMPRDVLHLVFYSGVSLQAICGVFSVFFIYFHQRSKARSWRTLD